MGTPKDLTLGHCSSESQAVHSSNNGYHNDHRGSSTYSSNHQREAAQDRLRILKEERRKVEGFKRELPLCIQLLDDAIIASEEKLAHGKDVVQPIALRLSSSPETENGGVLSPESGRPSLGEFIPLKRLVRDDQSSDTSGDGEGAEDYRETKCKQPPWMAEARLWSHTSSQTTEFVRSERTRGAGHSEQEQGSVTSSQQQQQVTGAGSFLPFQPRNVVPVVSRPRPRSGGFCADLNVSVHGERPATMLRLESDVEMGTTEAVAAAAVARQTPDEQTSKAIGTAGLGSISSSGGGGVGGGGISSCSTRKTRRCWSPELHSSFISALHQLGGPHIATPKQLRELMKVDGLTNDEVKSHLQKYRLHSRRPSSSSPHESAATTRAIAPQLVVVGSIWIPTQHAASAAADAQAGSQSGVSDPSQFCHSTPLPLDYFTTCISNGTPAAAGAAPMQMVQLHRQPVFKSPQAAGTSQSQTSPQGPLQVTSQLSGATQGSSSDTYETGEEEARSQSTSWKSGRQCEGGQYMTVESSHKREPAESKKLDLKVHEHDNAEHSQSAGTSGIKRLIEQAT